MTSKLGLGLALAYLVLCTFLIFSQGLFGESFIAIILGFPWSFLFAYFEYLSAEGLFLTLLLLIPIALNALLLLWIGTRISRKSSNISTTTHV